MRSFRWNDSFFEVVSSKGLYSESTWDRFSDLERVGLVAFELIWSENLVPVSKEQLEKIRSENDFLTNLLSRMDQIDVELQGLSGRMIKQA